MLTILLIILIIVFGIHKSIHVSRKAKLINKIPGPSLLPVIGNLLEVMRSPVELFYGLRGDANNRSIVRYWMFNMPLVSIYDPEDLEVVLSSSKNIEKMFAYDFVKSWLNDGLLMSKGQKWHQRRKILTPAFHFNILRQFCTILVEKSDKLVEKLRAEVGKSETEVLPFITEFALNSICETAMGTNLESAQSKIVQYKHAIYEIGKVAVERFAKPLMHIDWIYKWSSLGKREKKVINTLQTFTTDVIKERRKNRNLLDDKIDVDDGMDEEIVGSKKRLAMLDLLLKAESDNIIDESGIREEVDTFMFEGHDTTTMGLTFFLMALANEPEIQDKIVEETIEILGNTGKSPTIEDLNNMKYLERCIKESLRLYPSVPFIGRLITEDIKLKEYVLPAGTTLNIHIYDIHRNPKVFPNPLKFDPDRFLLENIAKRHPFAYIPFSAGPRNCIGQKFALLEMKAVVSVILKNYILEPVTRPDDIIFSGDLVLRSINPVKVKFVKRVNG